jgi:hypothetical protein
MAVPSDNISIENPPSAVPNRPDDGQTFSCIF